MFFKNKTVVFLGKWDIKDPLYRIYFHTLSFALRRSGVSVLIQGEDFEHIASLCNHRNLVINFFYKDQDSINEIKLTQIKSSAIICFGSDIFDFSLYEHACKVADIFVCPSNIHKLLLKTTLNKPIEVLIEAIDPCIPAVELSPSFASRRLVWFGFPENYHKSMLTIAPVIELAIEEGWIDSFTVISLPYLKDYLTNKFSFINYDEKTIASTLKNFDYALLSHFPLDGKINTFIKSSNKAIFSIMSGLLPICSRTPNYLEDLSKMNLDKFLFDSPAQLRDLLFSLKNYCEDSNLKITWESAYKYSENNFSDIQQLKQFEKILGDFILQKQDKFNQEKYSFPVKIFIFPEEVIKFRFYWRQKKKRTLSYLRKFFQ